MWKTLKEYVRIIIIGEFEDYIKKNKEQRKTIYSDQKQHKRYKDQQNNNN